MKIEHTTIPIQLLLFEMQMLEFKFVFNTLSRADKPFILLGISPVGWSPWIPVVKAQGRSWCLCHFPQRAQVGLKRERMRGGKGKGREGEEREARRRERERGEKERERERR